MLTTVSVVSLTMSSATASGGGSLDGYVTEFLFFGATILFVTTLLGPLAKRVLLPGVLVELGFGLALAAAALCGFGVFGEVVDHPSTRFVAKIGLISLIFYIGLENSIEQFKRVGRTALVVALAGILIPLVLGTLGSFSLSPSEPFLKHFYVGCALTATSIAVSSSVLQEHNACSSATGRVIVAAAVIDDVLVLLLLAAVALLVESSGAPASDGLAIWKFAGPLVFIASVLLLGNRFCWLVFRSFAFVAREFGRDRITLFHLQGALVVVMVFSGFAAVCGMEPIVGAFAAGLFLTPKHYRRHRYTADDMEAIREQLEQKIRPLVTLFAPVFFVCVGADVPIEVFGQLETVLLGLVLTAAAVGGKVLAGLLARGEDIDPLAVGFGMACRGEVALVFVGIGRSIQLDGAPIIDGRLYGALVFTIVCTAVLSPLLLSRRLKRDAAVGAVEG